MRCWHHAHSRDSGSGNIARQSTPRGRCRRYLLLRRLLARRIRHPRRCHHSRRRGTHDLLMQERSGTRLGDGLALNAANFGRVLALGQQQRIVLVAPFLGLGLSLRVPAIGVRVAALRRLMSGIAAARVLVFTSPTSRHVKSLCARTSSPAAGGCGPARFGRAS
ncbi:hypothetical protein BC828DRAFT_374314 [Blastocladiella britannica]|nr:hypothetical protein BC828DRAFT_374314 [Blastocladiella britannica]